MRASVVIAMSIITIPLISTVGLAQESTVARAPNRDALLKRMDLARKKVSQHGGRVIVGQVVVEEGDNPALVTSQMLLLEDGFFAGTIRDLDRPIRFRMHGYAPLNLKLKRTSRAIVDVGVVKMQRLPPDELVPIKGKLVLEGSGDPTKAVVALTVHLGQVNTADNAADGRPGHLWPERVRVPANASGLISADGFSPTKYHCKILAPGYVSKTRIVDFQPGVGADLGTIRLEKPCRIVIEYITSKGSQFDLESAQKATLHAGDRWKATPDIYGSDLNFTQNNGRVLANFSHGPCFIADLGAAELRQFVDTDSRIAKTAPFGFPVKDGHVYLVRQEMWKRNVLFRVQIQQPE